MVMRIGGSGRQAALPEPLQHSGQRAGMDVENLCELSRREAGTLSRRCG